MARKGSKEKPLVIDELEEILQKADGREFKIVAASTKDEYCDYVYEQTGGIGIGRTHKVTGEYIVMVDMINAFNKFNVHLAILDDAFKLSGIEVDDVDKFHGHEITMGYRVNGFKIKGVTDSESISFTGTKYSDTARGYFNITTPFIAIDGLASYKWYNELKSAADLVREEVALYHEGKYRVNEEDEDEEVEGTGKKKRKAKQLTIASPEGAADQPEHAAVGDNEYDSFDDFEEAKR